MCLFRCNELKILNSHLVSFVLHLRQKETPIACNKYHGNLAYLKESPVSLSFNTTVRDNVPLSHSESASFWQPSSVASQCHPWFLCHCLRPPTCLILSTFHLLTTCCKLCHQQIYCNLPISICQLCHPPYLLIIFLSQTLSQLQTATAQSHLPVYHHLPSVYPTTTATGQPQQPTISSALTLQMPTTTHLYTAETLDQPLNTPSPSIYSTITTTCTAELSSYLPIYVDNSDWLPYTEGPSKGVGSHVQR